MKKTWLQHLIFWLISFIVLYRLFTIDYQNGLSDVIYTFLFHLPLLLVVYLNLFLIKRWFHDASYTIYFIGFGIVLIFGIVTHFLVYNHFSDILFPGFYFVTYYSLGEIASFVLTYLILSLLLTLAKNWFALKEKQLALEHENHAVQLSTLKAQINPHFLFNSLNNIYSLSRAASKEADNYILKLSDALRYMIYDTEESRVLLENELDYIKNFIALENLRMEELHGPELRIVGQPQGWLIAPLLLLPMVENCYKHSEPEDPDIKLEIIIGKNGIFEMTTANKFNAKKEKHQRGIGLQNLEKRLHLIYGKKGRFETWKESSFFKTQLVIDLN